MLCLGETLIGTTEVSLSQLGKTECKQEKCDYLVNIFNNNITRKSNESNVDFKFRGLRPIVMVRRTSSKVSLSAAYRECKIESTGKLSTIYGSK